MATIGMTDLSLAQNSDPIQTLDTYIIRAGTVANETPLPTYATPVSQLSFAPQVDIQSRNFGEAQGDISIRGGTFENTGLMLEKIAVFDPQTGHYLAEVPVDPNMLALPTIVTGYENQMLSFNANAGSIQYQWNRVSTAQRQLTLSLGENNLNTQSFYMAQPIDKEGKKATFDIGISRSESNGTVEFGDHDFKRYSGRLQLRNEYSRLNLVAGYQDKFFGWPNMYTPYNVQETEDIQTLLLLADYELELTPQSTLNLASYYRVNWDDYEFDRDRPGIYNPYEHKTTVTGFHGSWETRRPSDTIYGVSADVFLDSIESTTLTHSFQSRSYGQLKAYSSVPNVFERVQLDASLSLFDTNRNEATINPSLKLTRDLSSLNSSTSALAYFSYTSGSQVSGYTAIGSSRSGLFAGNPDLDTERSHNLELGYQWQSEVASAKVALFYRMDRDLTDWTFQFDSTNARTANPVDIDTLGVEFLAHRQWKQTILSVGYTYLQKAEDYGLAKVDASFYALNFAKHRITSSLIQKFSSMFELRLDMEYRIQEYNPLRRSEDTATLAYLSVIVHPIEELNWDLRFSVENLFDSEFEEIPAVPASRRQFAIQSTWRW